MDIATSTLFCLHKSFGEALTDIVRAGTECIELVDAGPHTLDRTRVERLLELKSSYGLRYAIHAPFTDANLAADDPYIREFILRRLETSIRWASALGAEAFVFHPGNYTPAERFSPGSAWRRNNESVRRLLLYAEEYNVKAFVENLPEPIPYILKSVDDFERFFDEIGVETMMTFDAAHANLRGENLEFIKRFGERMGHVHVSDNNGEADVHLRLGDGSIDWVETMSALKGSSFDGWVTVESYEGIDESLRLLRKLS